MPPVFTYPCTLVGYLRLIFLGIGLSTAMLGPLMLMKELSQLLFIACVSVSLLLDIADGYLARKYQHVTAFGALFDFTIDLLTHTTILALSGMPGAMLFIALEWTTGLYVAVFALHPDTHWKQHLTTTGPRLLRLYFRHGQRNWLSIYGNLGHIIFPLWWFFDLPWSWPALFTLPGLLLYETVTFYMLMLFMRRLAQYNEPFRPAKK